MENESLLFLKYLSTFMQFATAVVASFYFYKFRGSFLKYFLAFLWITFFTELTGFLLVNNHLLYNVYTVLAFLYLFFMYAKAINDSTKKNILRIASLLYIVVLIIAGFYENYLTELQTISYIFGQIVLILGIGFYLTEILKSEKALYANRNLLFWISLGLFLFGAGIIPFSIVISYYLEKTGYPNVFGITFILIIIQNLCFIIGFVRADKNQIL